MKTMRTPAEDAALAAFKDAATSDGDPGYPLGAAFIPWQGGGELCGRNGARLGQPEDVVQGL